MQEVLRAASTCSAYGELGLTIGIVCPEGAAPRSGNRVTAERWRRILRSLGHRAKVVIGYDGRAFDALVVLHAVRGAAAARRFRAAFPNRPLIVALTGTDLYAHRRERAKAEATLALADRGIVLQRAALDELAPEARRKISVIYQSVEPQSVRPSLRRAKHFEVVVVGGLRRVKDPLRAAYAARSLPAASRIRVTCVGPALDPIFAERARREEARNPRFRWIGPVPHRRARDIIARSDLLALTSRSEGGANVIAEALAAGTPIVSSRIAGSIGMLGAAYPGYFPTGDTRALARVLLRVEGERSFRESLLRAAKRRAPLFARETERAAWKQLIASLQQQSK